MRAAIIEQGVVQNIIIITDGYEGAVPTGSLPVAIGDTYDGANFWRGGERVTLPEGAEELEEIIDILTGEGDSE